MEGWRRRLCKIHKGLAFVVIAVLVFIILNVHTMQDEVSPLLTTPIETRESDIDELLAILEKRIQRNKEKLNLKENICNSTSEADIHCFDKQCPRQFSPSLRERLRQVLSTRKNISPKVLAAMASSAASVTSHKFVFVTAVSSNHFNELQVLVSNIFMILFPHLNCNDYIFIIYDLGLTANQRLLAEKNCRCTLLDFPFSSLPAFVRELRCFIWKPLIVNTLLQKSEYLIWLDTSIQFNETSPVKEMLRRARHNGYQTRYNPGSIAVRTLPSMARFFGDELCQYSPFIEIPSGFVIYYNDRFMREAIMQPWLTCTLDPSCQCSLHHAKHYSCPKKPKERVYSRCHRFEQSSLGMIWSKLLLEDRPMLYLPPGSVGLFRASHLTFWE